MSIYFLITTNKIKSNVQCTLLVLQHVEISQFPFKGEVVAPMAPPFYFLGKYSFYTLNDNIRGENDGFRFE